jgi:serralysin
MDIKKPAVETNLPMKTIRILTLLALLTFACKLHAQVTIVSGPAGADQLSLDQSYTQAFDVGSSTGTWTDNTTLVGWYAALSNATAVTPHTAYTASSGGGTTSTLLYALGSSGSSERSLGASPSLVNSLLLGLRLVNGTEQTIDALSVSYDGEQWRKNAGALSKISVSYQIFPASGGSLSTLDGWMDVPALTFINPVVDAGIGAIDGNNATNRIAGISALVDALNLQPDDELWFKWIVSKISGDNIALSVDNVVVLIPEPSIFALLGLGLIGFAAIRRRR